MNGMFIGPTGSLIERRIGVVMCRWGGGAEPGMTHVFMHGSNLYSLWPHGLSLQCVIDDFGNLVEVA